MGVSEKVSNTKQKTQLENVPEKSSCNPSQRNSYKHWMTSWKLSKQKF